MATKKPGAVLGVSCHRCHGTDILIKTIPLFNLRSWVYLWPQDLGEKRKKSEERVKEWRKNRREEENTIRLVAGDKISPEKKGEQENRG
jgi:hypothetical protein